MLREVDPAAYFAQLVPSTMASAVDAGFGLSDDEDVHMKEDKSAQVAAVGAPSTKELKCDLCGTTPEACKAKTKKTPNPVMFPKQVICLING